MGMESVLVICATDLFSELVTTYRTVHFLPDRSFSNTVIESIFQQTLRQIIMTLPIIY